MQICSKPLSDVPNLQFFMCMPGLGTAGQGNVQELMSLTYYLLHIMWKFSFRVCISRGTQTIM